LIISSKSSQLDPLGVGADFDHRYFPALPGYLRDDRCELPVQQGLPVIEEAHRVDSLDVDVAQTEREVGYVDPMDLGLEGRIRAPYAAQLTSMHDVEMQRIDVARLKEHRGIGHASSRATRH
jgi:hypothetical protein